VTPADRHHVDAAQGWVDLGDWASAHEELENLSASTLAQPEALFIRWQVYALAGEWKRAVELAETTADIAPGLAPEIYYRLARFASAANLPRQARRWFEAALTVATDDLKRRMHADPVLTEFWRS
jgi:tetratricopeptide (TPR) repeat protein